jgi:hypothetical protein
MPASTGVALGADGAEMVSAGADVGLGAAGADDAGVVVVVTVPLVWVVPAFVLPGELTALFVVTTVVAGVGAAAGVVDRVRPAPVELLLETTLVAVTWNALASIRSPPLVKPGAKDWLIWDHGIGGAGVTMTIPTLP